MIYTTETLCPCREGLGGEPGSCNAHPHPVYQCVGCGRWTDDELPRGDDPQRCEDCDSDLETSTDLRQLQGPIPLEDRFESHIEFLFWQAHLYLRLPPLSGLVPQHEVSHYRLDFGIPKLRFGIELDGYEYHRDHDSFVNDRRRERALEMSGWTLIRFAGREIIDNASACVRQAAERAAMLS